MSEPIHGRVLHVKIQKTEESGQKMKNLLEEQSSTLYINETFVDGAGSSARTTRHYPKRKLWKISSTMLFSLEDFGRIFLAMRDEDILGVSFGHEYNGVVYEGNAFPTKITVNGNVHSLVKCQVEWQGTGVLDKRYVGDAGIYGVVIDTSSSSPQLERVGNMFLHQILPIQSRMRRCLLLDDGTVNYYLDENDSTLKADGSPANLDGSDGMVMVEIPKHYRRLQWIDSTRYRVDISEEPLSGGVEVSQMYVSAWEATVDRSNGNMLSSVINTSTRYRGGDNTSAWDGTYRSQLGFPATNISLLDYRTYARMRGNGWNCYEYRCHLALYWLFVIEYATLNSQAEYTDELTNDGLHQGGLSKGVSHINFTKWESYNTRNPFVPCGHTVGLGNNTGIVRLSFSEAQASVYGSEYTTDVPSYRGVENPFGHVDKLADGLMLLVQTRENGGMSYVYKAKDTSEYGDNSVQTPFCTYPRTTGYVKKIIANSCADIITAENGGSASTYFCDESLFSSSSSDLWNRLSLGGYAWNFPDSIGLSCFRPSGRETDKYRYIGTRLCYCSTSECFPEV